MKNNMLLIIVSAVLFGCCGTLGVITVKQQEEIQLSANAIRELASISLRFDTKHEEALNWVFEHWGDGTRI